MKLESLTAAVREAGALAREKALQAGVHVKSRSDFVTDADLAVSDFLGERLPTLLPGSRMISEEGDALCAPEGETFIVDPIDGTTNLMYGLRLSALSVGYLSQGAPVMGVVYNPFTEELFAAERGKGATLNGAPVHVNGDAALCDALIGAEAGPITAERQRDFFEKMTRLHMLGRGMRLTGSAALDLCYVACGRFSAAVFHYLFPWDHAAGGLILREAGGRFTSLRGDAPGFSEREELLCASNGALHEALLCHMRGAEGAREK